MSRLVFLFFLVGCLVVAASSPLRAAFGLTTSATAYTVDTGAGLIFKIRRDNPTNSTSPGDIMSLIYNGVELQDTTRGSQLVSGFDWIYNNSNPVTIDATAVGTDYILITVTAGDTTTAQFLKHYYIVRSGENTIYMATYANAEPSVGELRWITRLQSSRFTNFQEPSNLNGVIGNAESDDIFLLADGTTRSKFYGNQRAKDLSIRGITGPNVGVFMADPDREGASGGPFFRDIQNQTAEVYNYLNSGHNQTEAWRTGILHGPYALMLTTGSTPAIPDMSFLADFGLMGYVGTGERGVVAIAGITGRDTNYNYTVGFKNATAQCWADADPYTGAAICKNVKPGDYTMTIYKGELEVYTSAVTVTAGQTLTVPAITLTGDPSRVVPLWRVGNWDGTPLEFRNGTNINLMHPSDVRQAPWATAPFTVGSSPFTDFPSCLWKSGVNSNRVLNFTLTSAQIKATTVRIGITAANNGGRPNISVNSWSNTNLPAASSQPDSRSITIGTYRGNNKLYSYSVPSSALVVGTNTLVIGVISGSSGTTYLSPGCAIDCIEMYQGTATTLDVPGAPGGLNIQSTTTPNPRTIMLSWSATTGAVSYEIRRARSATGPFTVVASGLTALTWTDTDVAATSVYYYLLSAINGSGKGAPASAAMDPDGPPRPPAALNWTGSASSTWNATGALNWSWSAGSTYFFYPDDTVRFDDASTVNTLTLSGTLTPGSVTVNCSTKNYTFGGTGFLSGAGSLTKSGSGLLTLSNNANNYAGGTIIAGGTLTLGSNSDFGTGGIGTGGIIFQGGTLSHGYSGTRTLVYSNAISAASGQTGTISTPNRFRFNGAVTGAGTLNVAINTSVSRADFQNSFSGFAGALNFTGSGTVRLGINPFSGQPSFNPFGWANTTLSVDGVTISPNTYSDGSTLLIGALTSTGTTGTLGGGTAGTATYSIGAKNLSTTFAGKITGNAALIKSGSGTLNLSGANTYTGATTVSGGSLLVTGSLGATTITVASGATFGGTGTGTVGGTGIVSGNLTLEDGANLAFGVGPSSTKGVTVSGTSTLKGTIGVVPVLLGGTLTPGTYTVLKYAGTLGAPAPTFTWKDTILSGYLATFNHDTSNKIFTITLASSAAPPPAPSGLVAAPTNGQVSLSWNTASGATSYSVLRSTTSGSGYVEVTPNLAANSYVDTGRTNGTTYYYVVVARNAVGPSGNSNQASAKPVQSYSQWAAAAFPGETDLNIIALDADPDNDGYSNLLEYFYGTSPSTVGATIPITCAPDGLGNIVMAFPMSKNLSNVTYTVQQSTDLSTWTETNVTPTLASDQGAYYVMNATVPQDTDTTLFLRLTVTGQ